MGTDGVRMEGRREGYYSFYLLVNEDIRRDRVEASAGGNLGVITKKQSASGAVNNCCSVMATCYAAFVI